MRFWRYYADLPFSDSSRKACYERFVSDKTNLRQASGIEKSSSTHRNVTDAMSTRRTRSRHAWHSIPNQPSCFFYQVLSRSDISHPQMKRNSLIVGTQATTCGSSAAAIGCQWSLPDIVNNPSFRALVGQDNLLFRRVAGPAQRLLKVPRKSKLRLSAA